MVKQKKNSSVPPVVHNIMYAILLKMGDIKWCSTCCKVWHITCLSLPLHKMPHGTWFCPECGNGNTGGNLVSNGTIWSPSINCLQPISALLKKAAERLSKVTVPREIQMMHNTACSACYKGGDIILCDTCTFAWHLDCIDPPLHEVPQGIWPCPTCEKENRNETIWSPSIPCLQSASSLKKIAAEIKKTN